MVKMLGILIPSHLMVHRPVGRGGNLDHVMAYTIPREPTPRAMV